MTLVTRMVVLSNRNGHPLPVSAAEEPWSAYPMFKLVCFLFFLVLAACSFMSQNRPQQTNGYDCGIWVLCMMAAVMRGFSGVEVYEGDMPTLRKLFANHIQTLPIT